MHPNIRLGKIFGIEVGLHYSWLIIAFLIVFSLAGNFSATHPQWPGIVVWSLSVLTAIFFFISILIHELSHSAVAKHRHIPIRSITLFALGGVANIEESVDARSEFLMAIAGPLTSVAIGMLFLAMAFGTGWHPGAGTPDSPIGAAFLWLGYINLGLAVFNMIPGYPLDGGRVLRAALWHFTGSASRATRIAATVGRVIAFFFIVYGLLSFFRGSGFGGLWIAFIGWFLSEAATASYAETQISTALEDVRVGDVMSDQCPTTYGYLNLTAFVNDYILKRGRRCFVVLDREGGTPIGLATVHELKRVEQKRWPFTTLADIVLPLDRMHSVSPDTHIADAMKQMVKEDLNQLPVLANGKLVGIISRANIFQLLQVRREVRAA